MKFKSLLFGNANTGCWKLSVDDICVEEQVIAVTGVLCVEFFSTSTPMCISPEVLSRFAKEVHEIDRTLNGRGGLGKQKCPECDPARPGQWWLA
jgi:hypothetical protein